MKTILILIVAGLRSISVTNVPFETADACYSALEMTVNMNTDYQRIEGICVPSDK